MKHFIAASFVLFSLFPAAVAAKCRGEFAAPEALVPCACTVYNRIRAGWASASVLSAYYAPSVTASKEDIARVASVLTGAEPCGELYFMYGSGDVRRLHLEGYAADLVVRQGNKEVRFYRRWFRHR